MDMTRQSGGAEEEEEENYNNLSSKYFKIFTIMRERDDPVVTREDH